MNTELLHQALDALESAYLLLNPESDHDVIWSVYSAMRDIRTRLHTPDDFVASPSNQWQAQTMVRVGLEWLKSHTSKEHT